MMAPQTTTDEPVGDVIKDVALSYNKILRTISVLERRHGGWAYNVLGSRHDWGWGKVGERKEKEKSSAGLILLSTNNYIQITPDILLLLFNYKCTSKSILIQ